jgi:hypothetical protein
MIFESKFPVIARSLLCRTDVRDVHVVGISWTGTGHWVRSVIHHAC